MPLAPHDHGLGADLERWIHLAARRRTALRWLIAGGAGLGLGACGGGTENETTESGLTTTSGSDPSITCSAIPEETAGPYPGDGSNSSAGGVANALMLSGIVRSDIRASVAGATGVAGGVPLTLTIQLIDTRSSCASLEGYAIYLWHCDALGRYSMYSSGVTGENYLRGVQPTDASGQAHFVTIFPGCYLGRMPHMHFEVYRGTTTATSFANKLRTSQIAFPSLVASAVYANDAYASSRSNFARISFATDNVFSDGYAAQLATMEGDTNGGYTATLQVGIAA